MFYEMLEEFGRMPVIDFDEESDWKGPDKAYRVREEYDDETSVADRLGALLSCHGVDQLQALIIGAWSGACEGDDSKELVQKLVSIADRLPALKSLFIGEMLVEECELSWINQSDLSPVLSAFPQLECLFVRGSNGLSFSKIRHEGLTTLGIESGGLPRSVLRELFLCEFPNLAALELSLGEENYGFDGSVEDLQPLLSGELFPRLSHLGLVNSEIANDIAAVVVNSPIVDRIEVLDLSQGNMTDEGLNSLLALAEKTNLKGLDVSHHYGSEAVVAKLKATLPFEVEAAPASDYGDEADDDWRPILHAE